LNNPCGPKLIGINIRYGAGNDVGAVLLVGVAADVLF
jgi:hypothetical protein